MALSRAQNYARYRNEENITGNLAGDVSGPGNANTVDRLANNVAVSATANGLSFKIGESLNNTLGGFNVCVGPGAGRDLTLGTSNILFGQAAGQNLTTGVNNVCIGDSPLSQGMQQSTFVGVSSATNNFIDGSQNVGIGFSAFTFATNSSGTVAVGVNSGPVGAIDNCVCLGNEAKSSVDNGIALGYGAVAEPWNLNTQAPLAVGGSGVNVVPDLLGGGAPSAGASNRMRVKINGTNFTIALHPDE